MCELVTECCTFSLKQNNYPDNDSLYEYEGRMSLKCKKCRAELPYFREKRSWWERLFSQRSKRKYLCAECGHVNFVD